MIEREYPRRAPLIVMLTLIWLGVVSLARVSAPDRGTPTARPVRIAALTERERYPYSDEDGSFSRFVSESLGGWKDGPRAFRAWMNAQLPRTAAAGPVPETWEGWMTEKGLALERIADPARRAEAERGVCATMHRRVKLAIPRFSLDRGFEFRHTMERGERQCLLQSVLIASLLQGAGIDAGVVMVFRNPKGEESNNAHAVNLVHLAGGRAVLLDASEQQPFVAHQGIFTWDALAKDYRFLRPVYAPGGAEIVRFERESGGAVVVERVRPLPVDFLRSQFEYYRGERAPDGVLAKEPTTAGLARSAAHLSRSVTICPANPLPRFMRMRVLDRRGDAAAARREARSARRAYERYGWVPGGFVE